MNKQIEEMAKVINKSEILCRTCGESTYTYCADAIAETLYKANYRKASDVARKIFGEAIATIGKIITKHIESDNSLIETEVDIVHALAELKKKYESEGEE